MVFKSNKQRKAVMAKLKALQNQPKLDSSPWSTRISKENNKIVGAKIIKTRNLGFDRKRIAQIDTFKLPMSKEWAVQSKVFEIKESQLGGIKSGFLTKKIRDSSIIVSSKISAENKIVKIRKEFNKLI